MITIHNHVKLTLSISANYEEKQFGNIIDKIINTAF